MGWSHRTTGDEDVITAAAAAAAAAAASPLLLVLCMHSIRYHIDSLSFVNATK